jgi:hypothetical protein
VWDKVIAGGLLKHKKEASCHGFKLTRQHHNDIIRARWRNCGERTKVHSKQWKGVQTQQCMVDEQDNRTNWASCCYLWRPAGREMEWFRAPVMVWKISRQGDSISGAHAPERGTFWESSGCARKLGLLQCESLMNHELNTHVSMKISWYQIPCG